MPKPGWGENNRRQSKKEGSTKVNMKQKKKIFVPAWTVKVGLPFCTGMSTED
jgi:hypothetical protein